MYKPAKIVIGVSVIVIVIVPPMPVVVGAARAVFVGVFLCVIMSPMIVFGVVVIVSTAFIMLVFFRGFIVTFLGFIVLTFVAVLVCVIMSLVVVFSMVVIVSAAFIMPYYRHVFMHIKTNYSDACVDCPFY